MAISDGEFMSVSIFESPSADVISVEKMVSQKGTSDIRVNVYPLQAKERIRTGGAGFIGHVDSSDVGPVTSRWEL